MFQAETGKMERGGGNREQGIRYYLEAKVEGERGGINCGQVMTCSPRGIRGDFSNGDPAEDYSGFCHLRVGFLAARTSSTLPTKLFFGHA